MSYFYFLIQFSQWQLESYVPYTDQIIIEGQNVTINSVTSRWICQPFWIDFLYQMKSKPISWMYVKCTSKITG